MPAIVDPEAKRRALEDVLASPSFARSEQLRHLLRFIAEMEIEGRGEELSEHEIAIRVLGRGKDFVAADDATVRNRFFVLRKKLQEYYDAEGKSASLRIEVPKGAHAPRFLPRHDNGISGPYCPVAAETWRLPRWLALAAAFLAGVVLTAALLYTGGTRPARLDPVLAEAWGPLISPQGRLAICVATPAQALLREYRGPALPPDPLFLAPEGVQTWFQLHAPVRKGERVYALPTRASPLWGDAMAASVAARLVESAGGKADIIPERTAAFPTFRGRSLILAGDPEYSAAVSHYLERTPLTIVFDPQANDHIISGLGRRGGPKQYRLLRERDSVKVAYGLITVLPGERGAPTQRVVIFSGVTSAGTLASAEFFASPSKMRDLRRRLGGFPAAYQVVVRTGANYVLPIDIAYESHEVFAAD